MISCSVRNGDVGCSSMILSYLFPCIFNRSITSRTTLQLSAVSLEVSSDLRNDASAPYFSAINAYLSLSVDTNMLSKHPLFSAASMEYAKSGFPNNSLIFLSFTPFDPLLAGIIAIFLIIFLPLLSITQSYFPDLYKKLYLF